MTTEPVPTPPTEEPREGTNTAAYWRKRAEAAWQRGDEDAMTILRLHAEIARLRSDLNQATAVVEAAEAWRDQFVKADDVAWPRRGALIAAVDAYRAFRSSPSEGNTTSSE